MGLGKPSRWLTLNECSAGRIFGTLRICSQTTPCEASISMAVCTRLTSEASARNDSIGAARNGIKAIALTQKVFPRLDGKASRNSPASSPPREDSTSTSTSGSQSHTQSSPSHMKRRQQKRHTAEESQGVRIRRPHPYFSRYSPNQTVMKPSATGTPKMKLPVITSKTFPSLPQPSPKAKRANMP